MAPVRHILRYVGSGIGGATIWDFITFVYGFPGDLEDSGQWYSTAGSLMTDTRVILYVVGIGSSAILFSVEWWWPRLSQWIRRQKRIYTHRTIDEIFTELHGHTDMQNESVMARYLGKWVEVERAIYDIMPPNNGRVIVGLSSGGCGGMVFLVLDEGRWREQLETLVKGDWIRAEGQFISGSKYLMVLHDCHVHETKRRAEVD